ncbi:MAG: sensor histidine kinase [Anaerolineales bacterium]|jgi:two-component system sensor histidine kinase BaeS
MLKSLRNRLILSHVLPILIIIPVMGIALIYVLETQFLLPTLTRSVTGESLLIAEIVREQFEIWNNPKIAGALLDNIGPNLRARVMLISPNGTLLASTDPNDQANVNKPIHAPRLNEALSGKITTDSNYYSSSQRSTVIDVLVPVISSQGKTLGVVRETYRYDSVTEEILHLRNLIGGIIVLGLIVGAFVGFLLAISISTPIRRVTQSVFDLARGDKTDALQEVGPEEVRTLLSAFNLLNDRLHSLEDARRRLLANLVHELGRPLGALRSATQALMHGASDEIELRDELLRGMDDEANRLQHLLDDLSHLHDQVLGSLELDRREISMSDWLNDILGPWREAAKQKHLHWTTEIPANLNKLYVDPIRLGQAIGNLASNAIKFTPTNGAITISAGQENNELWIRVSDTGPGISDEEKKKILAPFYRGGHGRRFPQGMGLGLGIANNLVEAHGGRLVIESTPGLGSDFIIRLPLFFVTKQTSKQSN